MCDLALLVCIGEEELSSALIRGLPAELKWHVVGFNPTMLSKKIQPILLGEATLAFGVNEHINVVSEIGMATTVQIMNKRLDKLEDLLKSCQLSKTNQKNHPLQRQFCLICRACGVNDHISSYGNSSWVNQRFNNNPRNYNNVTNRSYINFYSQRKERGNGMGANTFQPRAIRGGYNHRYYNSGVEINYNMNYNQNNGITNSIPPRV